MFDYGKCVQSRRKITAFVHRAGTQQTQDETGRSEIPRKTTDAFLIGPCPFAGRRVTLGAESREREGAVGFPCHPPCLVCLRFTAITKTTKGHCCVLRGWTAGALNGRVLSTSSLFIRSLSWFNAEPSSAEIFWRKLRSQASMVG